MALPNYSHMSLEEYFALDRASHDARYEYIDGQINMLAGGSFSHSRIALNLARLLDEHLEGGPCTVYNSDVKVQLAESRYVYPDITVTCDEREENDLIRYPRMVVEVLSPGTEAYDRGFKFAAYRGCQTLEDYVLIDSQIQSVEVFHRERTGWSYYAYGSGDIVELKSIKAHYPIASIYQKIRFKQ